MATECIQKDFGFHPLKHREIRPQFDGGAITAEGGGLLLREVEKRIGIVQQFSACFRDYRDPDRIDHTIEDGQVTVFLAADHCTTECVGLQIAFLRLESWPAFVRQPERKWLRGKI